MIRDRIVVGVRDDTTRHKLLQIRDLTLAKAIDACKASEAAGKQLKAMTDTAEVQALHGSTKHRRRMETGGRNSKNDQRQRRRDPSTAPTKPRALSLIHI